MIEITLPWPIWVILGVILIDWIADAYRAQFKRPEPQKEQSK